MKRQVLFIFTILVSFILSSNLCAEGLIELTVVKDYNSILKKCSDEADSKNMNAVDYRDSCVIEEWNNLIKDRVIRSLSAYKGREISSLSTLENEILSELADWREARKGCEGLGAKYVECMNYQIHMIEKAILEEINHLNQRTTEGKNIVRTIKDNPIKDCIKKNGSCSSCHCNEILSYSSGYDGYPLCSKILNSASELYKLVLATLIEEGYLNEGEPYTSDIYDLGRDLVQGMQIGGWTIESATEFPSMQTISANRGYSDHIRESTGCFEGSTEVTRLSIDSGFLGLSSRGVKKEDIDKNNTSDLYSEKVEIKDIEKGDYVLSSTVMSVLSEHLHKTCWAEVGQVNRSTLGDHAYGGFQEIEYKHADHKNTGKIKATPKQRFYAYRYNYNDGEFFWFQANSEEFNNPLTHVYSTGFSGEDNGKPIPRVLDIVKVTYMEKDPATLIYNLSMPRTFTFFVGNGLLAHNIKITI